MNQYPLFGRVRVRELPEMAPPCRLFNVFLNDRSGAGSSESRKSPGSLLEPVDRLGSRPSKLNDGYVEIRAHGLQRLPTSECHWILLRIASTTVISLTLPAAMVV